MTTTYELTVKTAFPGMPEMEYIEQQQFPSSATPQQAYATFQKDFQQRFGNVPFAVMRIRLVEPRSYKPGPG